MSSKTTDTTTTSSATVSAIAGLLIVLFCYTAMTKLAGHIKFHFTLEHSPLLKNLAGLLSWLVPGWEIVIVSCLFVPALRRIGLLLSFVTMLLFTLYIGYMLLFADKLPCSCGGIVSELKWWQHFLLNIFLTLAAWAGYRLAGGHGFFIPTSKHSQTPV